MKLSIIIPVYNEAPYLSRCLDSIEASDDTEVIIVDDGSTDGSLKIAREYPYKVIAHSTNWGVGLSRNHGMMIATGDYITFLDSDDMYSDNAVTNMLRTLNNTDENIIQFNHSRPQYHNLEGRYTINNLPKKWVLCWNKAYKRAFLEENGITFPSQVTFEEDRIFNLRCFNYCPSIHNFEHNTVIKCFDNKQSICHTVDDTKMLSITRALTKMIETENCTPEVRALIRRCMAELWESKNARKCFGE